MAVLEKLFALTDGRKLLTGEIVILALLPVGWVPEDAVLECGCGVRDAVVGDVFVRLGDLELVAPR